MQSLKSEKALVGDVQNVDEQQFDVGNAETQPSVDELFNSNDCDVNFRAVSWPAAAILIAKLQIGLGALSLPSTFHALGFFPGILCFLIISAMTTWSGYVCGNARRYYPRMHSIGDASELLFGPVAREIVGVIYYLYLAMTAGAGMLATSAAFNALSSHATCTMAFVAVAAGLAMIIGTSFRALDKIAWISWAGVTSIIVAIWVTAIACLTQDRPSVAPPGPYDLKIVVFPDTTFASAMMAIANQVFAVGASATFFTVSAEMREPEKFTRSLLLGQGLIVVTCLAIASIVYGKIGQYLANPALGSAGPLIKKVAYGIGLPGLAVTAILFSHIAAKYWFVRILRGTHHLQNSTIKHWAVWVSSMFGTVAFGYIVVGVIPFFGDFLSLVGALLNPIFACVLPGFMIMFYIARKPVVVSDGVEPNSNETDVNWMVDSFKVARKSKKDAVLLASGLFMILIGSFIVIGGTYATVLVIKTNYDEGRIEGVFSCADNSG